MEILSMRKAKQFILGLPKSILERGVEDSYFFESNKQTKAIRAACDLFKSYLKSLSEPRTPTKDELFILQEIRKWSDSTALAIERSSPYHKRRSDLSMPLFHTDAFVSFLYPSEYPQSMKILPYLISSFYINGSILNSFSEDSFWFDYNDDCGGVFLDIESKNNKTFAQLYSLADLIDNELSSFHKSQRISNEIRSLHSRMDYARYLSEVHIEGHSQKIEDIKITDLQKTRVLFALIYSLACVACMNTFSLQGHADYGVSFRLFNQHTLSFYAKYSLEDSSIIKLYYKDLFKELRRTREKEYVKTHKGDLRLYVADIYSPPYLLKCVRKDNNWPPENIVDIFREKATIAKSVFTPEVDIRIPWNENPKKYEALAIKTIIALHPENYGSLGNKRSGLLNNHYFPSIIRNPQTDNDSRR